MLRIIPFPRVFLVLLVKTEKKWEKSIIIMYYNCAASFLLFLSDANCIQIKFKPGSIRRMWNSVIWNRILKESVQCIANCGEMQPDLQITFLAGPSIHQTSSWKNTKYKIVFLSSKTHLWLMQMVTFKQYKNIVAWQMVHTCTLKFWLMQCQ